MSRSSLRASRSLLFALFATHASGIGASEIKSAPQALQQLFEDHWTYRLAEDPLFATSMGDRRANGRLPSLTLADIERRTKAEREFLRRVEAIDPGALSKSEQIDAAIFCWMLRQGIEADELGAWRCPLTADWGFHSSFAQLPSWVPLTSFSDYQDYISRLRDFPRFTREHIAILREGLRTGFTLPRVVLEGYDESIRAHVVAEPESSVLWKPFTTFPATIPQADQDRLKQAGRAAIAEAVVPAYREFLDFMLNEYMPGARRTTAAADLPNGRAYYAHLVRRFTTLDLTPGQVHATGLAEVARIRAEMEDVMRKTGFQGSFSDFLTFLRTDMRFYAASPEELLKEARSISKQIDGQLPRFFGRLPRLPYGVEPVPTDLAPKFTGGRYVEAPIDGSRAGIYWVNTHALESRPLYVLESLTLHEAVPGHHLQIALQQELTDVPKFRRTIGVDAYSEGWALYAEKLGREIGLYKDPYSDFGRLTYEMWRACRLVVDTGLHALGWSREQAMDYLASNTALSLHEVKTETDRYISWPGQALAYKTGELKIVELRARAEKRLGEDFDLRSFHDTILATGPVPLPILEQVVEKWIATRAADR